MSGGESLAIETTAFAVLALIKASPNNEYATQIRSGVEYINKHRGGYGQWGNTQATILGLKALTAYAEHSRVMAVAGSATLVINGKDAGTIKFEKGRKEPLVWKDLASKLSPGKNTIEVRLDGGEGKAAEAPSRLVAETERRFELLESHQAPPRNGATESSPQRLARLGELAHVGRVEPRGHVPVDVADVVVVLVLAQVGQVEAGAAEQRAVIALQQAVQATDHRPLEPAQDGFGRLLRAGGGMRVSGSRRSPHGFQAASRAPVAAAGSGESAHRNRFPRPVPRS